MTQILIAAFDRYEQAEQVKAELTSQGVASEDIQISASSNPDMVKSSQVEVTHDVTKREDSLSERVTHFFHSVFGEDSDKHAGGFSDAMRRGSTIVTVSVADESQVSRVEEVMNRNGAIDIDEQSDRGVDGDSRPATASTAALTTGYPDATSVSVGTSEVENTRVSDIASDDANIPGRSENERASGRDNTAGRVRVVPR